MSDEHSSGKRKPDQRMEGYQEERAARQPVNNIRTWDHGRER